MLYSQAVRRVFEAPWSPGSDFLPPKTTPEEFGNSSLPYRSKVFPEIPEHLRTVRSSEQQQAISRWSHIYEFSVPIRNLHPSLEQTTILHLSDVHFLKGDPRPILELQHLARWLRKNEIFPDVTAFTGDVITKLPEDLCSASVRALADIAALSKHSLFVHGNHDYHGKVPEFIASEIERSGFTNLTSESIDLHFGGGTLNIHGIDDAYFGSPRAPRQMVSNETNIVLVHNLDAIRSNFPKETDLILSGHTHWGELRLPAAERFPILDGMWWMGKWGYSDNINHHTRHWDALSDRTLSFVHPGLARYYVPRMLAHPPGFVLHRLTSVTNTFGSMYSDHFGSDEKIRILMEAAA
jgi:predicted phosphodiesterase